MIHPIAKGKEGGAISCIKVPAPTVSSATYAPVSECLQFKHSWNIIDDEDEVMSHLLSWNKLHQHQAWDTPCAKGP
eukprot:11438914-Ditylum_brightwellii.AAC.1